MKRTLVVLLFLFLITGVYAISADYYYAETCGYCQEIKPFMIQSIDKYNKVNWNLIDVSKGSYNIPGTPFLKIRTDDNREIELSGSNEIPTYLQCELSEQSNLNCPTYSANECRADTWFIR